MTASAPYVLKSIIVRGPALSSRTLRENGVVVRLRQDSVVRTTLEVTPTHGGAFEDFVRHYTGLTVTATKRLRSTQVTVEGRALAQLMTLIQQGATAPPDEWDVATVCRMFEHHLAHLQPTA